MTEDPFLPGVPVAHVCARLAAAGGDEIDSGKFAHPKSSAALAVNAFGWFIERPMDLPPHPAPQRWVRPSASRWSIARDCRGRAGVTLGWTRW
jgi:hypothetical protein